MTRPDRKRTRVEGVLLLALLVGLDGLLVFLIAGSIRDGLLARASRSWPAVPGLVTSAQVSTSRPGRGALRCWPDVRYEYMVGQTLYTGRRVAFREGYGCKQAADIVDRDLSSPAVTVHVRPGEPATAVLEPGSRDGLSYLGFHVPLTVVMLFATLLFARGLQAVWRAPPRP